MAKVVTVVLKRDGSLHVASDKISLADAERWAEEGHSVFIIATQGKRWGINQLPSGKIIMDDCDSMPASVDEQHPVFKQLTFKGDER